MCVSFRPEYLDSIRDLCEAFYGDIEAHRVVWEFRYLTRDGGWVHYYGAKRDGDGAAFGQQWSVPLGWSRWVDPATMVFALLDFQTNPYILAYGGTAESAFDIFHEVENHWALQPEIFELSMVSHGRLPGEREAVTATRIAFVGLTLPPPEGNHRFVARKGAVSQRWFRGRRSVRPDITVLERSTQELPR
jgi:hypothetical protein